MRKKQNKRKYTKKNPTPTEKLAELQSNYNGLVSRIAELQSLVKNKEYQNTELSSILDKQMAEITMLRERNITLIEAIEILARASRLSKQQECIKQFGRTVNEQVSQLQNYGK